LGASVTDAQGGGSVSTDQGKATYFVLAPRVGYILPLTDMISFWPRGGISFNLVHVGFPDEVRNNVTTSSSLNTTLWAIDLEPIFVLSPVEHFGIYAGPVIDIPLTGNQKQSATVTPPGQTTEINRDYSSFHFGITAGLLGWF